MRAVARFAIAIAFSRDRRHRWRQVSVGGGSAVAAIILLLTVSLVSASLVAQERAVTRQAPLAVRAAALESSETPPEGAVAKEIPRITVATGRQVHTQWIQPLEGHSDDPAAVPRGLSRIPAPGEAVLSPRLVNAGITAEDLGWKSSDAGTGPGGAIGQDGLSMASDPLIYVRPGAGMELGTDGGIRYIFSYQEADPRAATGLTLDAEVLAADVTLYGAAVFLLIPGLILLVASSRARSPVRDSRLHFLHLLGARRRTARLAMGIENGALGAVGAICGAALYGIGGPFLTAVPLTTIRFFRGDLAAPWWAFLAVAVTTTVVTTLCGAMGRLRLRRAPRSRTLVPRLALAALVISIGLAVTSAHPAFRGPAASNMFVISSLSCIAVMPLAIPRAVSLTAARLSSARNPALWAAARRLQHDPVHLSRMASILSVLIVVSSLAVSMWGAATATQAERTPSASATAVSLSWREPAAEALIPEAQAALDEAGIGAVVLPLSFTSEEDPGKVRIPDCEAFAVQAAVDPAAICGPDSRDELREAVKTHTGHELLESTTKPAPDPIGPRVIVLSADDMETQQLQQALGFLPALALPTQSWDLTAPLPLVQWIVAGGFAAFVILALAVSRELGDRTIEDRERESVYRQLGLGDTARTRLTWTLFLFPTIVATALAFVCGTVLAYAGSVHRITEGDVTKVGIVSLVALAILLGTVTVAMVLRRTSDVLDVARSRQ
ncbi:MAG: hypothetical protein L0G94_18940 [Brachybacterium sp.]|uniref:FtsX-like permease family protein n=1 Tax=Brachybacterium sp. TaxID=1891286 RepID=UPI0026475BE0|nr:FtsX-like permease family protein [Brachybacterium sp.]MDN5688732.1 hypothetical protein [Brachybacterium sp.]